MTFPFIHLVSRDGKVEVEEVREDGRVALLTAETIEEATERATELVKRLPS